jgi:peptidoglycan/xylan/chitin deacetylase (PgdA/CDA1 family)
MNKLPYSRFQQTAVDLAAGIFWRMPGSFEIARILGPTYSLRCVVFHNISAKRSPFTTGMNVTSTPSDLERALKFLTKYYSPVRLEDILADADGHNLPARPVLVTFDDAYASVMEVAAPLCKKFGVPAIYFVNAAFLNNQRLAADNLLCYVANVQGMKTINAAACTLRSREILQLNTLTEVFQSFLPSLTLAERQEFLDAVLSLAGVSERRVAEETALYLTTEQLRSLASFDFEIGNHTYSHVHCRSMVQTDFVQEIDRNKAELETLSRTTVRSFSQPYGSSKDLTTELAGHLERSGHKAVFLSESVANPRSADVLHLNRVNPRVDSDDSFFFDLEVLPRLRAVRNRLRGSGSVRAGRGLQDFPLTTAETKNCVGSLDRR